MAYASWSVVFGEQPSAAKWNILGTNDASFNDGTGIGDGVIEPVHLDATQSDSTWVWQDWAPTYANITVGTGTVTAKYIQTGKTIIAHWKLVVGGTTAIGNAQTISLPVTANSRYGQFSPIGHASYNDGGAVAYFAGAYANSTTVANIFYPNYGGASGQLTSIFPVTEATGDIYEITFWYEAA